MRKPKSKKSRMQSKHSELNEVELLKSWIESQQPEHGSNPMSLPALPSDARAGRLNSTRFWRYAGATRFDQLPISKKTKDALPQSKKYVQMSDIQRACLPHALCGRDVRGASKTGSGKTLAFVIPDGVASIIISPTREIASQTFDVLRLVGRHHSFSAALQLGGRRGKDVEAEKVLVNECNILVCTPGGLLQHMDETPHFDCSQLQVFVLDEVDSMLSDPSFKQTMNAIISQLPKQRQTLLFSATHPKDVKDLTALCLEDPEFLSVHEKSVSSVHEKSKRGNTDEQEVDDVSDSEGEPSADRPRKRPKIYFDIESDGEIKKGINRGSLLTQYLWRNKKLLLSNC